MEFVASAPPTSSDETLKTLESYSASSYRESWIYEFSLKSGCSSGLKLVSDYLSENKFIYSIKLSSTAVAVSSSSFS